MEEKQPLSFCNISEDLPEYQLKNYISSLFWAFKSKLQIIHAASYVVLFLPDSNNCFLYVQCQCHISLSGSTILSFCVFIFHLLFHSLLSTRHILQFTMFDSISLVPARNISEIRNTSQSTSKKNCRVNYNQPNALIFS